MKNRKIAALASIITLIIGSFYAMLVQADELKFIRLVNNTDQAIFFFYASPQSSRSWRSDRLGSSVLLANYNIRIDINDGTNQCVYDLKAVFEDEQYTTRYGVNVCDGFKWILREDD